MTGWVILVDQPKDLPNADTPHKVITTSEYLARPRLFTREKGFDVVIEGNRGACVDVRSESRASRARGRASGTPLAPLRAPAPM